MKTTVSLPDELIQEAMQLTDVKNKSELITLALQELIKKSKVAQLKSFKGTIDLEADIDFFKNRNAHSS